MKENRVGYKFEDAHIRLGSKIHLDDFYYAEKLFVNSHYAQRFACSLFFYIKDNLKNWLVESTDKKNIHILGYGIYSELLLSNLLYLLKTSPGTTTYEFKTTIVRDAEGLKIDNEQLIKTAKNIILIIPIGTTLTTSIKICKKLLDKEYGNPKIIGTPITCIVVKPPKDNIHLQDKYWHDINEKDKIITLTDEEKTKEKYFMFAESDWREPHNCKKCFPDREPNDSILKWLTDEKTLFETDKVSVVPSIIFSLPRSKKINDDITLLKKEHIYSRQHIVRGRNHFLHYIDTNKFYSDNQKNIENWLKKIKNSFSLAKPVVLIAPEHNTNAEFANDVNNIIFGGTGILIHFSPDSDYKTNFKIFYGDLFTDKNPEIVLIDDAICSGNTLNLLREFIKYAGGNKDGKKIKVISMIDRSPKWFDDVNDFESYSFLTINLPPIRDERFCYLCREVEAYGELIEKSIDLGLRRLFLEKRSKIDERKYDDILLNESSKDGEDRRNRYFERIRLINKLTKQFDEALQETGYSQSIQPSLESKLNNNFSQTKNKYTDFKESFQYLPIEEKMTYIKVLAYPHFSLFKNIKIAACKLLLNELRLFLTSDQDLTSEKYKYLFLLIKTAGKLNLNIILRNEVIARVIEYFNALPNLLNQAVNCVVSKMERNKQELKNIGEKNLFNSNVIETLEKQYDALIIEKLIIEEIKKKPEKERLYSYAAAVKEVIYRDEAKSFRLECELNNNDIPEGELKKLLLLENVTIFQQALKIICGSLKKYKHKCSAMFNDNDILKQLDYLNSLLYKDDELKFYINDDYRFEYLRKIIYATDKNEYDLTNNENGKIVELKISEYPTYKTFLLTLLLKLYLEKFKYSNESIQVKMSHIVKLIKEIMGVDGCFVTVRRYNFNINDKSRNGPIEPDPIIVGATDDYVYDKDIDKRFLTYECWNEQLNADKKIETNKIVNDKKYSEFNIIQDIQSLCVIAITEIGPNDSKKDRTSESEISRRNYGVVTLYTKEKDSPFKPQIMRMMMLVTNDFLGFLKKNYENDSFVELLNNKYFEFSLGHISHWLSKRVLPLIEKNTESYNQLEKERNFLLYYIDLLKKKHLTVKLVDLYL
jgi:hypothetical protein